jgi:HEAT repeat protein
MSQALGMRNASWGLVVVLGLLGGWAEAGPPPGPARLRGYAAALQDADDAVAAQGLQVLGWEREDVEPADFARAVAFVRGPRMERLLRHPIVLVRLTALDALARLGDVGGQHAALVGELLKDPDERARALAATALGSMGKAAKAQLPLLLELLDGYRVPPGVAEGVAGIVREDPVPVLEPLLASSVKSTQLRGMNVALLVGAPAAALAPRIGELLMKDYTEPSKNQSDDFRRTAVLALGKMGPAAVSQAPRLAEVLRKDSDFHVRQDAAEALGEMGAVAQAASLGTAVVSDGHEWVRVSAARALGKMGPAARDQASLLVRGLRDESSFVGTAAGEALAKMGPLEKKLFVRLVSLLSHPSEYVRKPAAQALGGSDVQVQLPVLLELLKRDEPLLRAGAANALGSMGSKARGHAARLAALARDPEPDVRSAAINGLEGMGEVTLIAGFFKDADPGVRSNAAAVFLTPFGKVAEPLAPALGEMLRNEPDASVRESIRGALRRLGAASGPYVPLLARDLDRPDSDDTQRAFALAALDELGEVARSAAPLAARFVRDRDYTIRLYAVQGLGSMRAREQIPLLVELLAPEENEDTRFPARYALERMSPLEPAELAPLLARAERVPAERPNLLLLAHAMGGGAPSVEALLRWAVRPVDEAPVVRLPLSDARVALGVLADFWPATEKHPGLRQHLAARVAQVAQLATGSWTQGDLPLLKRHEANLAPYPAHSGLVRAAVRAVGP